MIVRAGEQVRTGKRDAEFPGWLWCTDARGKSSWCPEKLLRFNDDGTASFTEDYSALELDVVAGEQVTVERIESGWAWVTNNNDESGWVPIKTLDTESAP